MARRDTPEERQARGTAEPKPGRCGKKLVLTNPPRYCTQWPRKGRDGCKFHGGNTLRGVANPGYKGSFYSDVLKGTVRDDYDALLKDPALLSMRGEIAVTRARIKERLRRISEVPGLNLLNKLDKFFDAWDVWQKARQVNAAAVKQATPNLELAAASARAAMDPERREADAGRELRAEIATLAILERNENQHVKALYDMISGERAFAMRQAETTVFLEAIDKYVPDGASRTDIRRYVAAKFAEFTGRRDLAPLDPAGGLEQAAPDPGPTD